MKKEELLSKIRKNINKTYDMPSFDNMKGVVYDDKLKQFAEMSKTVGGKVVELQEGQDINELIRKTYPEAKVIASNLK
ncbi:MAG: hypothetical protein MR802_14040, partial [Prevotella sp.]|nr:hypothetical protein [Prevotella sp.]